MKNYLKFKVCIYTEMGRERIDEKPLDCGCVPYRIEHDFFCEDREYGVDLCKAHATLLKKTRKRSKKVRHEKHYQWHIVDGDANTLYKRTEDIVEKYPKLTRHIIFNHIVRKGRQDLQKTRLPEEYKRLKIKRIRILVADGDEYLRET